MNYRQISFPSVSISTLPIVVIMMQRDMLKRK